MTPEDVARIEDIESGIYVLTEDVANPEADRRVRHDWRQHAVWKKGDRFTIVSVPASEDFPRERKEIGPAHGYSHQRVWLFHHRKHMTPSEIVVSTTLLSKLQRLETPESQFRFWFIENHLPQSAAYDLLLVAFLEGRIDLAWMTNAEATRHDEEEDLSLQEDSE